jgi:hypothetical protein
MFSWNPSVSDTEHAGTGRYTLTANADGGLMMEVGGGKSFAFRPEPGGWTVDVAGWECPPQLMHRPGGILVLEDENEGGRPAASWSPLQAGMAAVSGGTILLADGDLFQVLDRPGREPGYDLIGWQGGGAYFASGHDGNELQVVIHPAGSALLEEDRGAAVLAMFVAVVAGLASVRPD